MKFFILFFLSFPVMAESLVCPPEIKSEQKILDVPKGWKSEEERLNARQMLRSVAIYEGPVDDGATLAPTESSESKNVWIFEPGKPHYLACAYGMTYMLVVKDLKKATRCEVEYKNKNLVPTSINCF